MVYYVSVPLASGIAYLLRSCTRLLIMSVCVCGIVTGGPWTSSCRPSWRVRVRARMCVCVCTCVRACACVRLSKRVRLPSTRYAPTRQGDGHVPTRHVVFPRARPPLLVSSTARGAAPVCAALAELAANIMSGGTACLTLLA